MLPSLGTGPAAAHKCTPCGLDDSSEGHSMALALFLTALCEELAPKYYSAQ